MMPEDKLHDLMARSANALDAVPSMADEVLRRINLKRAEKRPSRMSYRISLRERIFLMSYLQKIAAVVILGVLLVTTGWAVEKVVEVVIEGQPIQVKAGATTQWSLATEDGRSMSLIEGESRSSPLTQQQSDELSKLIAEKKYKLKRKYEMTGGTQYIYTFVFSDGTTTGMNFYVPLEDCKSLADYNQKRQEYQAKRQEAIRKAVVKGRFRLINIELLMVHRCVDVATRKALRVQQVNLPDGKQIATTEVTDPSVQAPAGEQQYTEYETTWKEHLDAIKAGRRKLLDAESSKNFWYEITLEDGSKTIWNYGGDLPLEKLPKATSQPAPASTMTGK